ncbi:hypothetical protein [Actinoplanes xinjiangensis]|uniref:Uncharacterized protein n=1 Tax=Actinoplanes xinjiangensis TaxID=512350 RepID=A0A316F7N1_9ACTN|nr:hypothetical protein [Actinoplanes xinjiangensis]PWK41529.1 hypothetical protein BC793_1161 [Actinoplanes xinjiangensis]GIF42066.1 hypothetical protein Axi01nite_63770 [Actinoplanes xinjiangensis]
MDRLDEALTVAGPLLERVDEVLSRFGAPGGHDIWRELRRVRLLPGDAARSVAALHPAAIRDAAPELRADARAYADLADALPLAGGWTGEAADAYEKARRSAAEHLNGGPGSLGHRMSATADLADSLANWMLRTRADLAAVLAEVMVSAEAVLLTTGEHPSSDEAAAAAAIGTRVLRTAADGYDEAEDLLARSADLQTPMFV